MRWSCVFAVSGLVVANVFGGGCSGPTKPDHPLFRYPLAVGNEWKYTITELYHFQDGRDSSVSFAPPQVVRVSRMDTLPDRGKVYHMELDQEDAPWSEWSGTAGYINSRDGLYQCYVENASQVVPKSGLVRGRPAYPGELRVMLPGLIPWPLGDSAGPKIGDEDDGAPLLVLPYPQHVGLEWVYRERFLDEPVPLKRQITGIDSVVTAAGTFECYLISWIYPAPWDNLEVTDWFSAKGMVRRVVTLHDMMYTDYTHPVGNGETVDFSFIYELESFELR